MNKQKNSVGQIQILIKYLEYDITQTYYRGNKTQRT